MSESFINQNNILLINTTKNYKIIIGDMKMVNYSQKSVEEVLNALKGWTSSEKLSDLKKELILVQKVNVDLSYFLVTELEKFQAFPTNSEEKFKELRDKYKNIPEDTKESVVESISNAKKILTSYISGTKNVPKVAVSELNEKINALEEVNFGQKEISMKGLTEFKENYLLESQQVEFDRVVNRAVARCSAKNEGTTIDNMVNLFINKGKDFPANSPRESFKALYDELGSNAKVMTFGEAVNMYLQTKEKHWNTTDNVYFQVDLDGETYVVSVNGCNAEMPSNEKDAQKLLADAFKGFYNGKEIETLILNELSSDENSVNHSNITIKKGSLNQQSYFYVLKDFIKNEFALIENAGNKNLSKLHKGYDYDKLGSLYNFVEVDGSFLRGCPVLLNNYDGGLVANDDNFGGRSRGYSVGDAD